MHNYWFHLWTHTTTVAVVWIWNMYEQLRFQSFGGGEYFQRVTFTFLFGTTRRLQKTCNILHESYRLLLYTFVVFFSPFFGAWQMWSLNCCCMERSCIIQDFSFVLPRKLFLCVLFPKILINCTLYVCVCVWKCFSLTHRCTAADETLHLIHSSSGSWVLMLINSTTVLLSQIERIHASYEWSSASDYSSRYSTVIWVNLAWFTPLI